MIDRLVEADAYLWAVSLPYAIAFTAVACEVAWLTSAAGSQWISVLRRFRVAVTMAAGSFLISVLFTVVLRELWVRVGAWGIPASWWDEAPVVTALVAFVLWDANGWLYHYVGHHTRVGWAGHQPHHTGTTFDLTLGLRQSWALLHLLPVQLPLALTGIDFRAIAVCAALSNCWQVLEHSSAAVRLPRWLSLLVMTPAAHRLHHQRDIDPAVNLGPVLTIWDRLAGTWRDPEATAAPVAYGMSAREPTSAVAVEFAGWRALLLPPGLDR